MKKQGFTLLILTMLLLSSCSTKAQKNGSEQAVLDNIATRVSVRSYLDKPVEETKIEQLLRAGMAAPSAMNKQPWHFVVVTDKQQLAALAKANPYAGMAVIDSCVVERDTLKVYFCLNDLVFLYDSVTLCHAFEYRAKTNYKHNFSLVLPLCGNVPFEGNVVMLQSFCFQYFFKRIKKNKFQFIECQSVDMKMEDAVKLGLRIEYTSIRH